MSNHGRSKKRATRRLAQALGISVSQATRIKKLRMDGASAEEVNKMLAKFQEKR